MAVTPGLDHSLLAIVHLPEEIQGMFQAGTLSPEDASLVFERQAELGGMTLGDVVGAVEAVQNTTVQTVSFGIQNPLDAIEDFLDDLKDGVKRIISRALEPFLDFLPSTFKTITSMVEESFNILVRTADVGLDKVLGVLEDVEDFGRSVIREIEDVILGPVVNAIQGAIASTTSMGTSILNSLDEKLEPLQDLGGKLLTSVGDVIEDSIAPVTAIADALFEQVSGFATALREALPELAEKLIEGFVDPLEDLRSGVANAAKTLVSGFFLDIAEDATDRIDPIITMLEEELNAVPALRKLVGPGALPVAAIGGLIAGFALPMILSSVASTALAPFAEKLRQRMNMIVLPGLLSPADIAQGESKGFISGGLAEDVLAKHGLSGEQQRLLMDLVKTRLGTMDIIDYWRRELISQDEARQQLRTLGWNNQEIDLLQQAAFPPPGVQDLIRMAVREVFSPEIATQFGQFDEIPPAYLMWAERIGLSTEWARNFWAAHWSLPGVQQGFEMLHRGVITEDDLENLLVALDVMPFWRQGLKEISFRPYTRVDVRRMFALNIIDRSQVLRAYLDLGFDPEKAENMTEFTVRWVEDSRKVEKEKERDLTKADVLGLFNDGLLNAEATEVALRDLGYDEGEAELLIAREELQELRQDRKAEIKLIVEQAKIKVITFQTAQDMLNALDLTQKEIQRALVELTRATQEKVRLPSKGDLDAWKGLNLLSLAEYGAELDNLGFPAKYVALYQEAVQMEEAGDLLAAEEREARKSEPRPVTKGQLDSLLRTDIIDSQDYLAGLTALNYAPDAIRTFVAQIVVEMEERRLADEARRLAGEDPAVKEKLLSRVVLGKLLLNAIINVNAYSQGLEKLGFSPESRELLIRLITVKIDEKAQEEGA